MHRVISLLEARSALDPTTGANIHLQCGYFESGASDAGEDVFSALTIRRGVELAADLKARWPRARIQYCTLVNDLGQSCGEDGCSVDVGQPGNALDTRRAQVEDLLRRSGVEDGRHAFLFERNLRNRGMRLLKKQLASGHPRLRRVAEDDGSTRIELLTRAGQAIPLATQRGSSLIGKCPIIMAAFYRQAAALIAHRFHRDPRPTLVVDLCHVVDEGKVMRGIEVMSAFGESVVTDGARSALQAPGRTSVVPVFMDEDGADAWPRCVSIPH